MQNVLVPTDFTAASIKMVENAIRNADQKVNIILFHAFSLPDSPFDLLTSDYRKPEYELMTDAFRIACKQLKDAYPNIVNKISINCMQGNTVALFRNFIEAKDIDQICCPIDYSYTVIHKSSVNPIPFFKKAGILLTKELTASKEYSFKNGIIFTEKMAKA